MQLRAYAHNENLRPPYMMLPAKEEQCLKPASKTGARKACLFKVLKSFR
jgi:hypothetical protein